MRDISEEVHLAIDLVALYIQRLVVSYQVVMRVLQLPLREAICSNPSHFRQDSLQCNHIDVMSSHAPDRTSQKGEFAGVCTISMGVR